MSKTKGKKKENTLDAQLKAGFRHLSNSQLVGPKRSRKPYVLRAHGEVRIAYRSRKRGADPYVRLKSSFQEMLPHVRD